MEKIRYPNPKCGRHILDIAEMPPGETVLEMKCRRCGEVVRVGFDPKKVHKKNRRQAFPQKHGPAVGKPKQVGEHTIPGA